MNQNKIAFVLEGGAMRGLYTVGVLDTFMKNGINTHAILGVSAGALFGINFKSKQMGRALRYNLKYAHDKRYMSMYSLLTTGDIMNKKFCFDDIIYKLDKFDFETFNSSPIDFFAVVTNLETGKAEYIKIDDAHSKLEYLRASGSMPFVSNIVNIDDAIITLSANPCVVVFFRKQKALIKNKTKKAKNAKSPKIPDSTAISNGTE